MGADGLNPLRIYENSTRAKQKTGTKAGLMLGSSWC